MLVFVTHAVWCTHLHNPQPNPPPPKKKQYALFKDKCFHGVNCRYRNTSTGCDVGQRVQQNHVVYGSLLPLWGDIDHIVQIMAPCLPHYERVVKVRGFPATSYALFTLNSAYVLSCTRRVIGWMYIPRGSNGAWLAYLYYSRHRQNLWLSFIMLFFERAG